MRLAQLRCSLPLDVVRPPSTDAALGNVEAISCICWRETDYQVTRMSDELLGKVGHLLLADGPLQLKRQISRKARQAFRTCLTTISLQQLSCHLISATKGILENHL